jgi:hypothetical protein
LRKQAASEENLEKLRDLFNRFEISNKDILKKTATSALQSASKKRLLKDDDNTKS